MSSRDHILERVRAGLGQPDFVSRRAAALAHLASRRRGPQPVLAGDLVERFWAKAVRLSSSVAVVGGRAAMLLAVRDSLDGGELGRNAVVAPEVAGFDWPGAGLSCAARSAVDADTVGITSCFCAIAETGTLMLLSGPDTPATVSLLPETHIALVPTGRIVATMEDAFALLRAEGGGELPRAVNFISGPSRTGDIEQTIVLGAHGPCRVHLVVFGEG